MGLLGGALHLYREIESHILSHPRFIQIYVITHAVWNGLLLPSNKFAKVTALVLSILAGIEGSFDMTDAVFYYAAETLIAFFGIYAVFRRRSRPLKIVS